MTLYVAVTNDRYELPIAVAETQTELAIMVGVDISTICKQIKRRAAGEKECPRKKCGMKFYKVDCEESKNEKRMEVTN